MSVERKRWVRNCDVIAGDEGWVAEFEKAVCRLAQLTVEMTRENRVLLLSQVAREMLAESADDVLDMLGKVRNRLVVDNLGPKNLYGVEP